MTMQPQQQQQQQQNVPPPRLAANNPLAHLQQQVQGQHDPGGRLMPPSHQQQQQMAAAFNSPNPGFHGNHQYGGGGHPGNMQYAGHHHGGQQKAVMGYPQGNMAPPGGGGGMYQFNKMVQGGMYPGQAEANMYGKGQINMMGPGAGGGGPNAAFNPGQNFMGPHMGGMNRAMMGQGQMMMGSQYGGQPGQMGSPRLMMQHGSQMNAAMMGGAGMMQHPGGQSNGGPTSMMIGQAVPIGGPPGQQANMPMMVRGQMSPAVQMRTQTGSVGQSPMPSPMGQSGAMGQASPMGQHGSMGQASPMTSPMGQPGSVGQPSPMGGSPMGQPSPMQSPHGGQYGSSNHANMMNPAAVYGNGGQGPQGQYIAATGVRPGMMSPTQHAMNMQQIPRQHTSPPFMAANQAAMPNQKSAQFISMAGGSNHMNASGQYNPHMMSPPPPGSHAAASQQQLPDFRTFASLTQTNFTSSKPQVMAPEMCPRGNGGMVMRPQQQQQPQPQHHPSMSRFISPPGQMPGEQVPHPGMGQHPGMMSHMMRSSGQRMVSPSGMNSIPPQMVATNSMTTPTVTQSGPHRMQPMPAHTVTVGAHSNLNVPPNLHSNPMLEHQLHNVRHPGNHPGMANFGVPPGNMNNPGLHHGAMNTAVAAVHSNSTWSDRGPNNVPGACIPPSSPLQYHPASLKQLHITSSPASAAMLTCTVTMATASHPSAAPCGLTSSQAGHPFSRFPVASHGGHGASRPSSTSSTSSGPPPHHHLHHSESPAPWGSIHEHRDLDSKRHLADNSDIVDDVRRRDLASRDSSVDRLRDCDSRDSQTSSSSSVSGNTITVPFGWKRINENGKILYISPSGVHLPSMDRIADYLSRDGTCKCGLGCPLMINKVFNFEPTVGSRPWCADHVANDDLTKLCGHKRKIVAMATFQMSTLQKSLDHDGHNRAVDKNKMSHKKDGSVVKRKRGKKSSPDGIVSNFLSQRERSKEPSTPPGVGSGAGVGTAWQKYMEFFGQKSDNPNNPLSLDRTESDAPAEVEKAAISTEDVGLNNQVSSAKSSEDSCRSKTQQSQGDSSHDVHFPKQQSPGTSPTPPNHRLPKRLSSPELMQMKMLKGVSCLSTATSISSSEVETNMVGNSTASSPDIVNRRHSRPQQSNPMLNAYLNQSPMNSKLPPQHCSNPSMHYNQNDCRSGPGPQPLVWPDSPPPKKKFKIKGCKKRNNMLRKRARVRVLPEIPITQEQSSLSNVISSVGDEEEEEDAGSGEEEDFLHDDAVPDNDGGSRGSSPASSRIDTPLSSGQCTSTPLTSPHPSWSPPPHHTPSSTPHSPSLTPCSTPHRRTPSVHTPSPPNQKSTPHAHHQSLGSCNHSNSNYRTPFHLPSNDHGEMDMCVDGQTDLSNISRHKHKYCHSNKSEEVLASSLPLLPDRRGYKLQNLFNTMNPGAGNFPASSLLTAAARAQLTQGDENLPQLGFQANQSQPCLQGGMAGGPMMGFDDCESLRECNGGVMSGGMMNGHMAPLNGTGLHPNLLLQHLGNPGVNVLGMGPHPGTMNNGIGPMGGTASMLNIVNTPTVRFQKEQSPIQLVQNMITGLEATQNVITAALHSASLEEDDDDDVLNQVTTKPKHRRKSSSSESSIGVSTVTSGAQMSTASSSGIGSSVSSCDSGGSEAGNANDTDNTISDEGKDSTLLTDDIPECNSSSMNENVEHSDNLLPSSETNTQTVSIATTSVMDSSNNVIQLGSSSRRLCTELSADNSHFVSTDGSISSAVSDSVTDSVVSAQSTTSVMVTTSENLLVVTPVSTVSSDITMVTASDCSTTPAISSLSNSLSTVTSCSDSLPNSAIPLVTSSDMSTTVLPQPPGINISQSMLQPPVMQFVNTFGNPLLMPSQIGLFSPDGSVINGFVANPPVESLSQNADGEEESGPTGASEDNGGDVKAGGQEEAEQGIMDASNTTENTNPRAETDECETSITEDTVALNDDAAECDSVAVATDSKDVSCLSAESDTPRPPVPDPGAPTPAHTPKQKSKNKSPKRDRSRKSSVPTIASMLQNAVTSNSASSQVQVVPGIQLISSVSNPTSQVVDTSGQLPMTSVLMSPTSANTAPTGAPHLVDQSAVTMVSPDQMTINMNLAAAAASAQMQMLNLLPGFGMLNPSLSGLPMQPNTALLQMMAQQQGGDGSGGIVDADPETTAVMQQNLNQLQQAQLVQCNNMLQQLQQLPPNQLQMTLEQLQQNQLQLQEAISNLQQMQPQAFSQLPSTTLAQLPSVSLTGEPISGDMTLNPLTSLGQLAPQQLMQFISLPQQQDGVAMGTEDGMTSLAQMMNQMQENLIHMCPQLQNQFTPLAGSNATILNPLTTLPMPLAPDMMNLVTMSTVDSSGSVCDGLTGKMSTSVARSTNVNTVGSHMDTSVKISSDLKSHQNKSPSRCSPGKRKSRSPRDGSKSPKARSHAVADNDTDFLPNPAKLTKAVSAAVRGLRSRLNLFSEDLESDLPVVSSVSSIRSESSSLGNSVSNVNTITNPVTKVDPNSVTETSSADQAWTTESTTKTDKIKTEPDEQTNVSEEASDASGIRTNISNEDSPMAEDDVIGTVKAEDDVDDDKSSIEKLDEESEVCDSVSLPSSTSTHTTAEMTSPSTPQSGTSTPEIKSEVTDEGVNNECEENCEEDNMSESEDGQEGDEVSEQMMEEEHRDEDVNDDDEQPMVNGLDHFDDEGDDTIDLPLGEDESTTPVDDNEGIPAVEDTPLTEEPELELSEAPSSPVVENHSHLDENGEEVAEEEDTSHNESDESMLHNRRHLVSGDELDESLVTESEDDDPNSEDRSSHPPRSFNIGDLVWGQIRGYPSWPGKLVHGNEVKGNHHKTEDGKLWVKWFGNHMFTQVEPGKLKTLSEGLEAHHDERQKCRKGRKINSSLESAIQEAMTELDKQSSCDNEVKVVDGGGVPPVTPQKETAQQPQLTEPQNVQHTPQQQQQQPKLRQNKKTKRR